MSPLLKKLKNSLLHLVYPLHCLHCDELIIDDQSVFCKSCTSLLELIDPEERCPFCFGLNDAIKAKHCSYCAKKDYQLFYRVGSAFEYRGPAASLIKKLKYANQPYLASGAGAFLAIQFDRLQWPLPDAIIPVPLSFTHWVERGYNQSELLAKSMAHFLQVPVWNAIRRHSGDYSQAGLTLSQRKSLKGKYFKLKETYSLHDKTLLIIDDVMTTGSTLQKCAEVLLEGYPASLYAMTFCQT